MLPSSGSEIHRQCEFLGMEFAPCRSFNFLTDANKRKTAAVKETVIS